jgi:hypothetical protein
MLDLVSGGAQAAGSNADAVTLVDSQEHVRRVGIGLTAVTSLGLLDAVLNFPLRTPVHMCDVGPKMQMAVHRAPVGVFERDDSVVTRVLTPSATVVAALITGAGWRRMMTNAAAFAPFCQRVMVFDRAPRGLGSLVWEAQLAGIGIWIRDESDTVEILRPQAFKRRRWKPAGWRFQERAYAKWLRPMHRSVSFYATADHPSHTGSEESDLHEPAFPGM